MTPKEKKEKINVMMAVQAINKHIKGTVIEGQIRVDLPFKLNNDEDLRIYFTKSPEGKGKKLILFTPLSLLTTIPSSPQVLNELAKQYGTYLSEISPNEYLIVENSDSGLSQRTRNIMQAIIAIDGTIRIRKSLNAPRILSRTQTEATGPTATVGSSKQKERSSNGKLPTSTDPS